MDIFVDGDFLDEFAVGVVVVVCSARHRDKLVGQSDEFGVCFQVFAQSSKFLVRIV